MDHLAYSDLYDRVTVERCREHKKLVEEQIAAINPNDPMAKDKRIACAHVLRLTLYFISGDRAVEKESTIKKWLDRSQGLEIFKEQVQPRRGIRCLRCSKEMSFSSKVLYSSEVGKERVLLFYDCPLGCMPRRAFFNDGEEFVSKPNACEKCGSTVQENDSRNGDVITITLTCKSCGHSKIDTLDLGRKSKQETLIDDDYARDRQLYCLSAEAMGKYISERANLDHFADLVKRMEAKKQEEEKRASLPPIEMLNIAGLQACIKSQLESRGFAQLECSHPENNKKGLLVTTTVQDSIPTRDEKTALKEFCAGMSTLDGTNWKLVKSSVTYSLGVISARLQGFKNETDAFTKEEP